jgi:alpha-beta hydrolase superfamily lysophospholipase
MWGLVGGLACFAALILAVLGVALVLVASSPPKIKTPRDVFGFAGHDTGAADGERPAIERYLARDCSQLAYRFYDSEGERLLVFAHGSSYHSGGYHALASAISRSGAAKVVLPNLRGHYLSGRRRGDVDYVGQLEDDLIDLIRFLRGRGLAGPISLGGHSSGAGLAIRFAGGGHGDLVSSYLLLSPVIPTSPTIKGGTAGGWANLHRQRLYGLIALNTLGVHGYDGLPIVEFNKPEQYWDGTETLAYSYRLNVSYHPRFKYTDDLRALDGKALVLVGAGDEAIDAEALRLLFAASAPRARVTVLPGINHFGIFSASTALEQTTAWLNGS